MLYRTITSNIQSTKMLKTILIIVLSVTIFGVLFFLYVKKYLERRLNFYLSKNNKKNKNK